MNNELPKRKQNRLIGFDYSAAGAYFVTICTQDRQCIFGKIVGEDIILPKEIELSKYGHIVNKVINSISTIYPNIHVEKYIIMPNHVHMIIRISCDVGRMISSPTLQTIVGQMKRQVTKQCGSHIWQRSFYDHIIRNEQDYLEIWQYIDSNPAKWCEDKFYIGDKANG